MHPEGAVRVPLIGWIVEYTRLKTKCLSPQRPANGDAIGSTPNVLDDVFFCSVVEDDANF